MDHTRFDSLVAALAQTAPAVAAVPLAQSLDDHDRCRALTASAAGVCVDLTRQQLDIPTLHRLIELLEAAGIGEAMAAAAGGEAVNLTESPGPCRAMHTALRGSDRSPAAVSAVVQESQERMERIATAVRGGTLTGGEITDVVTLGTGGSWLGPAVCVDALEGSGPRVHFLPSLDGHAVDDLLEVLDPAATAVIVSSKSFSTQETITNASLFRSWLTEGLGDAGMGHMIACTADPDAARRFGIPDDHILEIWEWVGGRFSLWSAMGLPIAIHAGVEVFQSLRDGAAAMDDHVLSAKPSENLAWLLTATEFFNRSILGYMIRAELPYDFSLQLLPTYLQQLEMESLGKSTRIDGSPAIQTPCAVIGQTGSEAQHTFLQALHQGTQVIPAEFIGVATPRHDHRDHHLAMARNLVGQAEALARGRSITQTRAMLERQGHSASEVDRLLPHRTFAGNRPSTIITLQQLDARCLGGVLALFEYRVQGMATAWSINAFDQWGVELGKTVAGQLASSSEITDSAAAALRRLGVE